MAQTLRLCHGCGVEIDGLESWTDGRGNYFCNEAHYLEQMSRTAKATA